MSDPARVADALERLLDVIEAWAEPWTAPPSDRTESREPVEGDAEVEPESPRGAAPTASSTATAAPRLGAPPIHFRGLLGSRTRARSEPEQRPVTAGLRETVLPAARPASTPTRVPAHRGPLIAPSATPASTAASGTTATGALRARDALLDPMHAPAGTRAPIAAERHAGLERENSPPAIPFASAPMGSALVERGGFGSRAAFDSPAALARRAETTARIEPDLLEDFAQARSDRDQSSPHHEDLEERLADVLERAALESGIEIP